MPVTFDITIQSQNSLDKKAMPEGKPTGNETPKPIIVNLNGTRMNITRSFFYIPLGDYGTYY